MPAFAKIEIPPHPHCRDAHRRRGEPAAARAALEDDVDTLAELILWQEQLPRSELPRCRYEVGLQLWLERLADQSE